MEINVRRSDWQLLADQWERHLKARNKAASTRTTYLRSLAKFADWACAAMAERGPYDVTEDDVDGFLAHLFETPTRYGRAPEPDTVAKTFREIKVFFGWLARREKFPHPMAGMQAPMVPEKPVPVLVDDDLRRLLKAIPGDDFTARRDRAIIRMLFDTGCRRAEIAALELPASVNLTDQFITVMGKGRRERQVPYGANTAEALDDYLRVRMRHKDHRLPQLWLAATPHRGPLGYDGVHQMIKRVASRAGIRDVYAHRFRHTAANSQLEAGLSEGDAMRLFGWRTRKMVDRYGAAAAHSRAMKAARRTSHADRI